MRLIICLLFTFSIQNTISLCDTPNNSEKRFHCKIQNNEFILFPTEKTICIPQEWLELNQRKDTFHTTPEELSKIRHGAGQWDTEYAQVVNDALPFEHCILHAGNDGWGNEGYLYSDLQIRIYILEETINAISERIIKQGCKTVETITSKRIVKTHTKKQFEGVFGITEFVELFIQKKEKDTPFERYCFSFNRWYGDYGNIAVVDFRISQFEQYTIAVVFMYTHYKSQQETIDDILASLLGNPPEK